MIKVGIVGGAGYTAGELLRILIAHPEAKIAYIHSSSNAGKKIYEVHQDLIGDIDLYFSEVDYTGIDALFLCMGHGKSKEFIENTKLPDKLKIIDLSHDYRLRREGNDFVYGLPELNRKNIKTAKKIANPGCFATGIQLALLPLAALGYIQDEMHVTAITGSTGAGQAPSGTTHFSWRNGNVSVYKAFTHQHLGEIMQSLTALQPALDKTMNFVPLRGNFSRGILASVYTKFNGSLEDAKKIFTNYYSDHPFVHIVDSGLPDMKLAVNSNKCFLGLEKQGDKLLIVSATDNLIKGASGQAVQNMNLMFGLEETTGLKLKAIAF